MNQTLYFFKFFDLFTQKKKQQQNNTQKKNMKKISKEIKKVLKVSALKCLCNKK